MKTKDLKELSLSLKKDYKAMYKEVSLSLNYFNTTVWLDEGLFSIQEVTLEDNILKVHKLNTNK